MNMKLIICQASFCLNAIIHSIINAHLCLHNHHNQVLSVLYIVYFKLYIVVKAFQAFFFFIIVQIFSIGFKSGE